MSETCPGYLITGCRDNDSGGNVILGGDTSYDSGYGVASHTGWIIRIADNEQTVKDALPGDKTGRIVTIRMNQTSCGDSSSLTNMNIYLTGCRSGVCHPNGGVTMGKQSETSGNLWEIRKKGDAPNSYYIMSVWNPNNSGWKYCYASNNDCSPIEQEYNDETWQKRNIHRFLTRCRGGSKDKSVAMGQSLVSEKDNEKYFDIDDTDKSEPGAPTNKFDLRYNAFSWDIQEMTDDESLQSIDLMNMLTTETPPVRIAACGRKVNGNKCPSYDCGIDTSGCGETNSCGEKNFGEDFNEDCKDIYNDKYICTSTTKQCECIPDCSGATCGTPNGCGPEGSENPEHLCTGEDFNDTCQDIDTKPNTVCSPTGTCGCVKTCPSTKSCGDDDGCGGYCTGPEQNNKCKNDNNNDYICDTDKKTCLDPNCVKDCSGISCGQLDKCQAYFCTGEDQDQQCQDDNNNNNNYFCSSTTKKCECEDNDFGEGKCGTDGCGNFKPCPSGKECDANNNCISEVVGKEDTSTINVGVIFGFFAAFVLMLVGLGYFIYKQLDI